MERPTFYITTPIYYPNDNLHIGHAYTTVAADAIARFKRFQGYDVFFLTGTDEHGQKIQRRALAAGTTPQEFVDEIVDGIKRLWKTLRIEYDDFIRTTQPRHIRAVQDIFTRIQQNGDIYKSEYEGWYCVPCETFWLERQVKNGACPDCGGQVELLREESYFFRLSKYADRLLEYIETHPDFIQPPSRRNEMINFIKGGLEDLCISRTTFDWGIPVPNDEKHVIYVWFDALTNYISALGYPEDTTRFDRYWPADVHLVGKEIVRFHTIIWPIILMALGLPLPKKVFGHGWLVLEGGKMSKSKGNVIDPSVLVNKYGVDAVRYYLLREIPFGADGTYSESSLISRINSDLANDLGNLLHRTLAMIGQFCGGKIPEPSQEDPVDTDLKDFVNATRRDVVKAMDTLEISNALASIWGVVSKGNKYLDENAPWALFNRGLAARGNTVLYHCAETLRIIAGMLVPFLVETPDKILEQLGAPTDVRSLSWDDATQWGGLRPNTPIKKGKPLFPRIEDEGKDEDKPKAEAKSTDSTINAQKDSISIEEFRKMDLRVATISKAEKVEGADRLLKLTIDLGTEKREIVSGIAQHYSPADLIDKQVVVIANLQPAKIRGIESKGMLLAASSQNELALLTLDRDMPPGSRIS